MACKHKWIGIGTTNSFVCSECPTKKIYGQQEISYYNPEKRPDRFAYKATKFDRRSMKADYLIAINGRVRTAKDKEEWAKHSGVSWNNLWTKAVIKAIRLQKQT